MADYIRRAGTEFGRALAAVGRWCVGVTSPKASVRSDMYGQLVAQIRGPSPHLREAGKCVLQTNVHGIWLQLVEDFGMEREEVTIDDHIL
jgi:hypothetical protein